MALARWLPLLALAGPSVSAETVLVFFARGGLALGSDCRYYGLVRSLAAPLLLGCPAPRFSLPRCRDLARRAAGLTL